ncbi:MAG: IS110 family transposase [Acidobacteria bacterium]|nr:MAG: IS110 family transposase [Acidobacteriota bacterium]
MGRSDHFQPDIWIAFDAGKTEHFMQILAAADGADLGSHAVANDEEAIETALSSVSADADIALIIDLQCSIAQLLLAIAARRRIPVAYISGLKMRRASELYPGEAKTDPRDAYVLAETARLHSSRLTWMDVNDEKLEEMRVLCGYDQDLANEETRKKNRLRDCLMSVSPALERILGPRLAHPAVLELLGAWPTPTAMRSAGRSRLSRKVAPLAPRMAERLVADITAALEAQTLTLPGEVARGKVIAGLAGDLSQIRLRRNELVEELEELLVAHPDGPLLMSLSGIGVRSGTQIVVEIGDVSRFPTAGHLAAYAGLAPVTHRSGTSIRGERRSRRGNRRLKHAVWVSSFAALRANDESRTYYDKKREEGKSHKQAMAALCRRRIDVIYAMLRDHSVYKPGRPSRADHGGTDVRAA